MTEQKDRGWICPRCNSSNAPSVTRCDCTENPAHQPMQQFVAPLTAYITTPPPTLLGCSCLNQNYVQQLGLSAPTEQHLHWQLP